MIMKTSLTLAAALAFAGAVSAAPLFEENFDDEAATYGTVENFTNFSTFSVSGGTVDLIEDPGNPYGLTCETAGGCIDLDGSTGNAGLVSDIITLDAGQEYTLSFDLSGNQRGGEDTVTVTFYTVLDSIGVSYDAGWNTYTYSFFGDGNDYQLGFQNLGGDNVGALLDNVVISAVPVPAAGFLLLGALGGFGLMRRRKPAA